MMRRGSGVGGTERLERVGWNDDPTAFLSSSVPEEHSRPSINVCTLVLVEEGSTSTPPASPRVVASGTLAGSGGRVAVPAARASEGVMSVSNPGSDSMGSAMVFRTALTGRASNHWIVVVGKDVECVGITSWASAFEYLLMRRGKIGQRGYKNTFQTILYSMDEPGQVDKYTEKRV